MNEELIKKINQAIESNDTEMLERLQNEYGVSISIEKSTDKKLLEETKQILGRNNKEEIKKFEEKNNIKIDGIVRDENNNIKGITFNSNVRTEKINPEDMVDKKDINYFRAVPCNNDLFIIYNLASKHRLLEQESDLIGAFILRWINENKVECMTLKKGFFKREKIIIKFKDDVVIDDNMEKELYKDIKVISDDNVLEINDFYNWLGKNYYKFNSFLQNLKHDVEERLEREGLILLNKNNNDEQIIENNATSGYEKIIKSESAIILPKYKEYLNQIVGFKKFIKEFSLIRNRKITEVKLWQDYLVIAELLGIANYVQEQFKELFPKFKTKNKIQVKKKIRLPAGLSEEEVKEYLKKI